MAALSLSNTRNDDPRKLRELVQKAASLACHHDITSVMVGASGVVGDLLFSEMVDYISSALRVDDGICRLTRERTVFFIADADEERAADILERLMNGFRESFTPAHDPHVDLVYFVVTPEMTDLTVRDVLPSLFGPMPATH
jgi:hypothetical protein